MTKSNRKTFKYSELEKLAVGLEEVGVLDDSTDERKRRSLIDWFKRKGYLTKPQQGLAHGLIRSAKIAKGKDRTIEETKLYLCAIAGSQSVKLGMSGCIKKRMKTLQTSSPEKLSLKWQYFVGYDRLHAMKQERKLHRFCKKYRLSGEWFSLECMDLVRDFHVRDVLEKSEPTIDNVKMIENISSY